MDSQNSGGITEKLNRLDGLELELRPVEWLARSIWHQAGKTDPFDFDELYVMVGPSDEVVFSPPQGVGHVNLRSKLDELLSRTLEANGVLDDLSELIKHPVMRVNRLAAVIKLVRALCFYFEKVRVHGFDFPETFRLGALNWHRRLSTITTQMRGRRRKSYV
jgi:hypothetical protein